MWTGVQPLGSDSAWTWNSDGVPVDNTPLDDLGLHIFTDQRADDSKRCIATKSTILNPKNMDYERMSCAELKSYICQTPGEFVRGHCIIVYFKKCFYDL